MNTHAEGIGNQLNSMVGNPPPPTVAEYLFSTNNNSLVSLLAHDEADNFGIEPEGNRLYYHLV